MGSLPPRGRAISVQGKATSPLAMETSSLGKATSYQLVTDSFLPQERVISDQGWATAGPCWSGCEQLTSSSSSGCRPSCRRGRECATVHKPRPRLLLRHPRVLSLRSQRHLSPLPRCRNHPLSSDSSPHARHHCPPHHLSLSPHW